MIKRMLKWLFITIGLVFCVLSSVPYLFPGGLKSARTHPYQNSGFFDYNHTRFHYRIFKPKTLQHKVLLIHGFSASTFSYRRTVDSLLSHNNLVIAMDMPAFGYSDKSENANYTDTNKINAIHFLLEHVDKYSNNDKWHLIGHSMGGNVIGQFASAYPEQTRSLIFIDGLPLSQTHSLLQPIALYPPLLKWADVILEKHFLNHGSFQELLSSAYGCNADSLSTEGYMKPFETKCSGSAILRMAAKSGYARVNDSILNLIPKLLIWGKQDTWIPLSNAGAFLKRPNTRSFLIDSAGHCPMETHSKIVNPMITEFISKLE
jgi:pimeloyl-ACP methyl ester carboxylesterase